VTALAAANGAGMATLTALIQQRGTRVPGQPAAPGTAAGPLVPCRAHESAARGCRDAILLVDRPLPGLAPLLFGARGVIARSGAAGSHLAEVARSLGVPMVTGCRVETVTGPDPAPGAWAAAINGATGDVALLSPATGR
jgi:phosphohistidine swiveling domain-containing protein